MNFNFKSVIEFLDYFKDENKLENLRKIQNSRKNKNLKYFIIDANQKK